MTHLDPSRGPRVSPGGTRYYHVGYAIKMHWKKPVQFSMGHQIAKYASNFKKLDSFDIRKVVPVWIRPNS